MKTEQQISVSKLVSRDAAARLLPFDQFVQLVLSVRGDADGRNFGRQDPRAPLRGRVIVATIDLNAFAVKAHEGWVRDVSRSGLGVTVKSSLEVKSPVAVAMRRENDAIWLLGLITGRFALNAGGDGYGVRLVRDLSPAEVTRLETGDPEFLLAANSEARSVVAPFTCAAIPQPKRKKP